MTNNNAKRSDFMKKANMHQRPLFQIMQNSALLFLVTIIIVVLRLSLSPLREATGAFPIG